MTSPMSHVAKERKKLLARVNRIAGQIAALRETIERADDNAECHAVMHQIASIRGAMNGLLLHYLSEHVREHVALGATEAARLEEAEELVSVIRSFRS